MKITTLDAKELFDFGGYIDLETGECILSKWRYDSLREYEQRSRKLFGNNVQIKDYTVEDYQRFAHENERYLRVPDLNSTNILWMAALEIGISEEKLLELGFNAETKEIVYPTIDEAIFNRDIFDSSDLFVAEDKLYDYARSKRIYSDLMSKFSQIWLETLEDWFSSRGIELIDPEF